MSKEPASLNEDMKSALYAIITDAMQASQTAMAAAVAVMDIPTDDDLAFTVCDEMTQAIRHIMRAMHYVASMPTKDTK